jgi:hypothetical protein
LEGSVNGHRRAGYDLSFRVEALMDDGRRYEREQVVFVAPHNAEVELRSVRAT